MGAMDVGNNEWYYQEGYVELLYAAVVIGFIVVLFFFRRHKGISRLVANMGEERGRLLGLLALAVTLFVINRVLGDLW